MYIEGLSFLYLTTIDGRAVYINPNSVRYITELNFGDGAFGVRVHFDDRDSLDFALRVGTVIGQLVEKAQLIVVSGG
ncbi:MAG TPA: hypothetical protein VMU84_11035 [Thermoanaerobaculia bacterium]|nr:hypothetical protein [Thermoanaerobaculia bacterium]